MCESDSSVTPRDDDRIAMTHQSLSIVCAPESCTRSTWSEVCSVCRRVYGACCAVSVRSNCRFEPDPPLSSPTTRARPQCSVRNNKKASRISRFPLPWLVLDIVGFGRLSTRTRACVTRSDSHANAVRATIDGASTKIFVAGRRERFGLNDRQCQSSFAANIAAVL